MKGDDKWPGERRYEARARRKEYSDQDPNSCNNPCDREMEGSWSTDVRDLEPRDHLLMCPGAASTTNLESSRGERFLERIRFQLLEGSHLLLTGLHGRRWRSHMLIIFKILEIKGKNCTGESANAIGC